MRMQRNSMNLCRESSEPCHCQYMYSVRVWTVARCVPIRTDHDDKLLEYELILSGGRWSTGARANSHSFMQQTNESQNR